jgi:hypothetical protein
MLNFDGWMKMTLTWYYDYSHKGVTYIVVEKELLWQSSNWVVMSCNVYTMNCKSCNSCNLSNNTHSV